MKQYTNTCVKCNRPFSTGLPCCCDDGYQTIDGVTLHCDGQCVECCNNITNHRAILEYFEKHVQIYRDEFGG